MTLPAPSDAGSVAIETRGLGKAFGPRLALEGVDLARPERRRVRLPRRQRRRQDDADPAAARPGRSPPRGTMRVLGHAVPGGTRGRARPRRRDHRGAALPSAPHRSREPSRPCRGPRARRARQDRRLARARRPDRPRRRQGEDLLARHAPAARRRALPARRPRAADPRRAAERPGPGGHPRDAPADPRARRRGPDRAALLPPARRGREDLRRGRDRRRGQGRRPGHDPRAAQRRREGDRDRLPRAGRGRPACSPRFRASRGPPTTRARSA